MTQLTLARTQEGFHDAGYDAWVTGCVFARLAGDKYKQDKHEMMNKMYMMRSVYSLNLQGEDEQTHTATVVHISGFVRATVTADLINAFAPLSVRIQWIDDFQALGILAESTLEQALEALTQ